MSAASTRFGVGLAIFLSVGCTASEVTEENSSIVAASTANSVSTKTAALCSKASTGKLYKWKWKDKQKRCKVCEDPGTCAIQLCGPYGGCWTIPKDTGTACDDGDACTEADKCDQLTCAGSAIECTDGDPCTTDSCQVDSGCYFEASTGEPCDDGDMCEGEPRGGLIG